MAKVKLTAGQIEKHHCAKGQTQAFLWCIEAPGLGVRATPDTNAKRYIFQTRVAGKTMRVTIGKVSVWSIKAAQVEARRLQTLIDLGNDPRQVRADDASAKEAAVIAKTAAAAALAIQTTRESVTVIDVWPEYVAARKANWSALHLLDHDKAMQAGGATRTRSHKLTEPGPLASLAAVRLIDLTPERVTEWAMAEKVSRPTRARLALRLLRAFLFWCARHKVYQEVIKGNAAQSPDAREALGKAGVKNDVLQREQLPAWFAAVRQIGNPVISAYLQALLLTGARREELAALRWEDVDFQWNSLTIRDKMQGQRIIPLTPYVASLLSNLKRRNDARPNVAKLRKLKDEGVKWKPSPWVFSSPTAASGRLTEPRVAHDKACSIAGVDVTLHGLRRSFASLCEWTETPAGIAAQIQGHAPQGVRESNYIRRPLDLLRMWHVKIEAWLLSEAGIELPPVQKGLQLVANTAAA